MRSKSKTLAQALIAGLAAGLATAGMEALHAPSAWAADTSVGATTDTNTPPVAKPKRKPHKSIRNKNNCCKNGCDCMESKSKKNAPTK